MAAICGDLIPSTIYSAPRDALIGPGEFDLPDALTMDACVVVKAYLILLRIR
jgi:hypothetical protein